MVDARQQPPLLDEAADLGRQQRRPGVAGLELVDRPVEIEQQGGPVDVENLQQQVDVVARLFEELDEPMLDFNREVGARQAQPRRPLQGPLADGIELVDQRPEIKGDHATSDSFPGACQRLSGCRQPGGSPSACGSRQRAPAAVAKGLLGGNAGAMDTVYPSRPPTPSSALPSRRTISRSRKPRRSDSWPRAGSAAKSSSRAGCRRARHGGCTMLPPASSSAPPLAPTPAG